MKKTLEGCVSIQDMGRRVGVSIRVAYKYARELGITGGIPAEDAARVEAAFRNLREKRAERHLLLCRKGMHAARAGILTAREIGEAAGCSRDSAWYILHKKGWPSEIPPERLHDAVSVIQAELSERAEAKRARADKGTWMRERKKPTASPKPALEKSNSCDWRVSMLGRKGWLVVRCGTQEEMVAWARMLCDNGFTAEAVQNSYTPGVP